MPSPDGEVEALDSAEGIVAGTADERRPVVSLDQLYAQALAAATALDRLVAVWAEAGHAIRDDAGAGPIGPAGETLEVFLPPAVRALVRRGLVKLPMRALEKAGTCYRGDVSRVVDVVRARLRFESAAGLLACLERVCGPGSGARVLRIKNSLHDGHDSRSTAGFRVTRTEKRPSPAHTRSVLSATTGRTALFPKHAQGVLT